MAAEPNSNPLVFPDGDTIQQVFLEQARRQPNKVIVTDAITGSRTYRELITAIYVLSPRLEEVEGDYIGILAPASVGATVSYLSTIFAGKIQVMINWTAGERNIRHALEFLDVKRILSARRFVDRLAETGIDMSTLGEFIHLDELVKTVSTTEKVKAALKARLFWKSLLKAPVNERAVVLFTSGSENLPKAVPLSQMNILTNIRDIVSYLDVYPSDSLLGFLPPFHAFGITVTMLLPLCLGFPVVFHPNPLEKRKLAGLVREYEISMIVGTPTFLGGIARAASEGQMKSLRLAITGAETCPESVYSLLRESCPGMTVLEGYGVTECSPVVSVNVVSDPQHGTIGKVLGSVEHAIVTEDLTARVETGETGMLLLRGPSIFNGYIDLEGQSPFVTFEEREWYRTGDLVSEDDAGVLTFQGRLKRFLKIGGEMVSLPAIESVLLEKFYEVDDTPILAVTSTGDESHPKPVLVTTREISRESANKAVCDAGLSALHNIRRVVRTESIPTLGTGKTDYRSLDKLID